MGKGINVIYGLSDSGKSAFLRSILSVIKRDPFYLTTGKTKGSVEILFTDGTEIIREYTKKKTTKCPECKEKIGKDDGQTCLSCGYLIPDKPASDKFIINGEIKEKFGAKLPDFITEITRMYPYKFIDVEPFINVFTQHEDMFFIGKSYDGKYRNRLISALIVDSEKVDILVKNGASEKYSNNSQIKLLETEKNTIVKRLEDVPELIVIVSELEVEHDELILSGDNLHKSQISLETIQDKLAETTDVGSLLPKLNKYSSLMPKMRNTLSKMERMCEQADKLKSIQRNLNNIGNIDVKIPSKIDIDTETLEKLEKQISTLNSLQTDLNDVNMLIDDTVKQRRINKSEYSDKLKEFENYLKSDDTICPITKERFEADCLQKIIGDK